LDCVYVLTIYVYTCVLIVFYSLKRMYSVSCYTNIYSENNIKIILLITLYFFTYSAVDALFEYIECLLFLDR